MKEKLLIHQNKHQSKLIQKGKLKRKRKPKQIQIHHVKSDSKFHFGNEDKKEKFRGSSLKGQKEYHVLPNIKTICANCHSLEHHTRGQIEKDSCGLWLRKKTTNQLYKNPREMFKLDCLYTHT